MKKIIKLVCVLFLLFIYADNIFATTIIKGQVDNIKGKIDVTQGFDTFSLTGDSYAGYFIDYENDRKYKFKELALAGSTISQNRERINASINAIYPIVIFSIGVNDCDQNTKPEDFAIELDSILELATLCNKVIIMHSYMDYPAYHMKKKDFPPQSYDTVLKVASEKNSNLIYVDTHDMEKKAYWQDDCLHYNKAFYDEFYNRVEAIIDSLKEIEIK